jgi:short-subunit dehydrogenase
MARAPSYRNCLITGASSGIGRALALEVARDGVEVIACARREAQLRALVAEIVAGGGRARAVVLDAAECDAAVEIIRRVDEEVGGIDLVIANAGVGLPEGVDQHAWEAAREACRVNFDGAVATLTAILPRMIQRRRGHLVGVGSLAGFGALKDSAAYCAPKAGLSMFLECLRLDLVGTGVSATTVNPGFVSTSMVEGATHPVPFLMTPERAARIVWRRLQRRPARVDFPAPMALVARLAGALPRPIHHALARLAPGRLPSTAR